MFIQVIQGTCRDAAALHRQTDTWMEELSPGAQGWLGGTYGVTDDNTFVAVVRFESKDAAERNSSRPEQGAWWAVTEKLFEGDVAFQDCDEVTTFLDGGAEDAGFVQVIQGRVSDRGRFLSFISQPMDDLREARPDIIGGTFALSTDDRFTQTVAFRSEQSAREGESKEMPEDVSAAIEEETSVMLDVTYLDLHHPWFDSKA